MSGRSWFVVLIIGVLLALAVWFYGPRNYAYIQLNRGLAAGDETRVAASEAVFAQDPQAVRYQYGLANIYFAEGEVGAAAEAWLAAGETIETLLVKGEQLSHSDVGAALRWYSVAEHIDPQNETLWLAVGRLCQPEPWLNPICERFLVYNRQNMLLNADFASNLSGWQLNLADQVNYEVVSCDYGRCASWEIGPEVPALGATIRQCAYVEPEEMYRFSARLKVEVGADVGWRPVYVQGSVDGEQVGLWPRSQRGAQEWQLWEHVFQAAAFDKGMVCIHPVRLEGEGRIWVADVRLEQLSRTDGIEQANQNAHEDETLFAQLETLIAQKRISEAAALWQESGREVQLLVQEGERRATDELTAALAWYQTAVTVAPDDTAVWLAIGSLCQPNPAFDPLCAEFVSYNEGNLLLNGNFGLGRSGWRLNLPQEIIYEMVPCEYGQCAMWEVGEEIPAFGGTMYQCLPFEAGSHYRFTAQLKVTAAAGVAWRPVYIQGLVEGEQQGFWPQTPSGTAVWQTWTQEFQAPAFDDGLACVHPVRLAGMGQVWVAEVRLVKLPH